MRCVGRHFDELCLWSYASDGPARSRKNAPSPYSSLLLRIAERYAKIEHENRLLLSRMSEILIKPGGDNSYAQGARHGYSSRGEAPAASYDGQGRRRARSLHGTGKKRELARITRDNLALLGRLQGIKPVLNSKKWAKDAAENALLVASISEYKRSGGSLYAPSTMTDGDSIVAGAGTTTSQNGGGGVARGRSLSPDGSQQQLQLEDGRQQYQQQRGRTMEVAGGMSLAGRGGSLDRGMQQLQQQQQQQHQAIPAGLPGFGSLSAFSAAAGGGGSASLFNYSSAFNNGTVGGGGGTPGLGFLGGTPGAALGGSATPLPLSFTFPSASAAVLSSSSSGLGGGSNSGGGSLAGITAGLGGMSLASGAFTPGGTAMPAGGAFAPWNAQRAVAANPT